MEEQHPISNFIPKSGLSSHHREYPESPENLDSLMQNVKYVLYKGPIGLQYIIFKNIYDKDFFSLIMLRI